MQFWSKFCILHYSCVSEFIKTYFSKTSSLACPQKRYFKTKHNFFYKLDLSLHLSVSSLSWARAVFQNVFFENSRLKKLEIFESGLVLKIDCNSKITASDWYLPMHEVARLVQTRHSFAHGTAKLDQSKCFNCQAGLKLYCFQAKPKFAAKIRIWEWRKTILELPNLILA